MEKPEIILPQLIREMEEKVEETARAEAKALSAVKGGRRRLDTGLGRVVRLNEGALLAVKANKVDTARQAIAAQIQAEKEVRKCTSDLAISESAYNSAHQARNQLQDNLKELKLKNNDILKRSKEIKREQSFNNKLDIFSSGARKNILDMVAMMESKVDEAEAETDIHDEITRVLGVGFPYERVKVLESDAEVDRRLNELKEKMQGG